MVEISEYYGSLVAFEGQQDSIATQLRLLPTSSKILILPPIQSFVKEDSTRRPFDARSHILKTHEACDARSHMARAFLRESTPDNKRIVILNGGTASAQMSCIKAISNHETDGDIVKAEKVFNELIQLGTAGLKRQIKPAEKGAMASKVDGATSMDVHDNHISYDPILTAMKAADALDFETASLQSTLELSFAPRPRSMSVPARLSADDMEDAAPLHVPGRPEHALEVPLQSVVEQARLLYVEEWRATTGSEDQLSSPIVPRLATWVGEFHTEAPFTPLSAVGTRHVPFESVPNSPVLLDQAPLNDIRPSTPQTHRRSKSVDRVYASAIRNQDVLLGISGRSGRTKLAVPGSVGNKAERGGRDLTKRLVLRSSFYSDKPCLSFAQPRKTTARKGPPAPLKLVTKGREQSTFVVHRRICSASNHVHHGALSEPVSNLAMTESGHASSFLDLEDDFELDAGDSFQTVLPMTEDLVIHFKDEESERSLEAMIQAFKNGIYPVSMPPLLPELEEVDRPSPPSTRDSTPRPIRESTPNFFDESMPLYDSDDYDPFASNGDYLRPPPPMTTIMSKQVARKQSQPATGVSNQTTPLRTPPPPDRIYHNFDIRGFKTAVSIQDVLRSILNIYFSPDEVGYHQFRFPLHAELSSFWRPVFRETQSIGHKSMRKLDLILAIGAEESVNSEFLGAISGSIEKLGMEPNGPCRSARLDLRYFIANAIRTFSSEPLAHKSAEDPLNDPLLLATLIIPHLETYMAAHSATKFLLLEYPTEHLSTVLALQHLVGIDLLKIAGIVDAEASSPKSYRRSKKAGSDPSFSKANFILTSTATEQEIATLISSVWRILIDISPWYLPEHVRALNSRYNSITANKEVKVNNDVSRFGASYRPVSPSSRTYPYERHGLLHSAAVILGFAQPPAERTQPRIQQQQGPPSTYVSSGTYADLPPLAPSSRRPITPQNQTQYRVSSPGESMLSSRTTTNNQRSKLRNILGSEVFKSGDEEKKTPYIETDDDEDTDADAMTFVNDERRYMPLWSHEGRPHKGNSRKALKWLGIAN